MCFKVQREKAPEEVRVMMRRELNTLIGKEPESCKKKRNRDMNEADPLVQIQLTY